MMPPSRLALVRDQKWRFGLRLRGAGVEDRAANSAGMGGRRLYRGVLCALLLAGVLSGSGESLAQARSGPDLKGVSTIVGSRPSVMRVNIPDRLVLPLDDAVADLIDIKGEGRATGFVLLSAADSSTGSFSMYGGVVMSGCEKAACKAPREERAGSIVYAGRTDKDETQVELPAGPYDLYLIADGAPVRVRLRIPGLGGRATYKPTTEVSKFVTTPDEVVQESSTGATYSAGSRIDVKGREAVVLGLLRLRTAAWTTGAVGHCVYADDPPPSPAAFAPGCPAGSNTLVSDTLVNPFPLTHMYLHASAFATGKGGFGVWYVAGGKVDDVAYNIFEFEIPGAAYASNRSSVLTKVVGLGQAFL
jgi:hypothetical protein